MSASRRSSRSVSSCGRRDSSSPSCALRHAQRGARALRPTRGHAALSRATSAASCSRRVRRDCSSWARARAASSLLRASECSRWPPWMARLQLIALGLRLALRAADACPGSLSARCSFSSAQRQVGAQGLQALFAFDDTGMGILAAADPDPAPAHPLPRAGNDRLAGLQGCRACAAPRPGTHRPARPPAARRPPPVP